ncbi:MAG: hypothetical protein K8J31_22805 [Anaerolineae bacterium]|nr:hypothetical protein [Anaerolineae bacterium]
MIQRSYTLNGLNREALNAQLGAALGVVYVGFADRDTREGLIVTVNLTGAATQADIDRLNDLMADHDPRQLTPTQQARQLREQKLAEARRDYKGVDLDPADFMSENASIQTLAAKVAWLEQEIAALRGE